MNSNLQDLDLIDLISERHIHLRKLIEKWWNDSSNTHLSNSEWFILSRIYQKKKTTISYVTKHVDISRQATHKFIRNLEQKGLVEIYSLENNKKEKGLKLTEFGKNCFEKNVTVKEKLEKQIEEKIGSNQVQQLKKILQMDWGLD